MDCEEKHKDMKGDILRLFDLMGERLKWDTFKWSTRIIVIVFVSIFSLIGTVYWANAQEHEKLVEKDAFIDFRDETRKSFDKLEQLIRDIK